MPFSIVEPADSVDGYAWDDLLRGCADLFDHLLIFHCLSMLDVRC